MVKCIEIEYLEGSMVTNLIHSIQNEDFFVKYELDENNHNIKIFYKENCNNYMGIGILSGISIFLCADYIQCYSKYKNKEKEKNILMATIANDIYFGNTILIALVYYFNVNRKLKESVFFRFNMSAFGKELEHIIQNFYLDNVIKKASTDMHNILKKQGVNFKRFKTLKIDFDEDDCFQLISSDGTILSPENLLDTLGLDIEFEEGEDDFLTMIAFCNILIPVLDTKVIIIPKYCKEFYDVLSEQSVIIENDVSLVVKD